MPYLVDVSLTTFPTATFTSALTNSPSSLRASMMWIRILLVEIDEHAVNYMRLGVYMCVHLCVSVCVFVNVYVWVYAEQR